MKSGVPGKLAQGHSRLENSRTEARLLSRCGGWIQDGLTRAGLSLPWGSTKSVCFSLSSHIQI